MFLGLPSWIWDLYVFTWSGVFIHTGGQLMTGQYFYPSPDGAQYFTGFVFLITGSILLAWCIAAWDNVTE